MKRTLVQSTAAYMCNNQQPWAINSNVSYGFAAANIAGLTEADWCCTCYALTFTSGAVAGKQFVVQITNTGGDLGGNQFDLEIPGIGSNYCLLLVSSMKLCLMWYVLPCRRWSGNIQRLYPSVERPSQWLGRQIWRSIVCIGLFATTSCTSTWMSMEIRLVPERR